MIFLVRQAEIANVAGRGTIKKEKRMGESLRKEGGEEFWGTIWRRFWEGAWVWAAALALLALISLSKVILI